MPEKKSKFNAAKAKAKRKWEIIAQPNGVTTLKKRIQKETVKKTRTNSRG